MRLVAEEVELTPGGSSLWQLCGEISHWGFPHLPVPLIVKWQEFESESPPFRQASPSLLSFTVKLLLKKKKLFLKIEV